MQRERDSDVASSCRQAPMSLAASSSSSLPQLSPFHLNSCRWSWCSSTFPSSQDLIHHILNQHIRNAVPVKRADLPMLQRAEEGVGDSLSLSGMMTGVLSNPDQYASNSSNDPASSLPSPPASSPPSLSHTSPDPAEALSQLPPGLESSKSSQESRDCVEQQLTQSLEIGLESSNEYTGEEDSDVPTGHRSEPHLASNDLYAGEIEWNPPKRALAKTSESSQSSLSTGMTSSSQALLQPPSQRYLVSTPQSQPPPLQGPSQAKFGTSPPSIFPSSINSSTPAAQGQQSWYNQNPAALLQPATGNTDKALKGDGSRPGFFARKNSEASLSSNRGQLTHHVPPVNMFRSGTLQINPAAPQLVSSDSRRYAAPQVVNNVLLHHHHQEDHTTSRMTRTVYSALHDSQASAQLSRSISPSSQEFPDMLQTQAPYRSQSWGI